MLSVIKEIGSRRDLIRELVAKDLKLRYSRPVLGFFWALFLPLLTVLIFFVIFSLFLKVQIEEAPFVVYVMTAVFTWRFFSDSLSGATTSLVGNKNLLREARFPAYFLPLSVVLANAVNFLPPLVVMLVVAGCSLQGFPVSIVWLPFVLAVHFLITAGLAIILSILYLRWRDMPYVLEAFLLLLFYLTPAFYSLSLAKTTFPPWLYGLFLSSPLTGILNFYRFSLLKGFDVFLVRDTGSLIWLIVPVIFAGGTVLAAFLFYKRNKNMIYDHLSY